jgi:predicted nucleic acid-binding protein
MVFDSSTLILLAKIDLLREVTEDVHIVIPQKVKDECLLKESPDALTIKALLMEHKIEVEKTRNHEAIRKLQMDFRIETAEAQALWLSRSISCPIAVDDGPTIKACKVLGVQFTTAVHFLLNLHARKKLKLPMALAKLEKLSSYGRYHKRIIEDAAERLKGAK